MIKVLINGCNGKMGQEVAKIVNSDEEFFYPKEDLSILNRKRNNRGFISLTVISILLIVVAIAIFLVIKK